MNSWLFYDVETVGLNKCFDQILEFAAIRTDAQWQPIQEIHHRLKLNRDQIPSAQAMLIHQLPLSACWEGMSEYEAIVSIHRLFNTPNTCTLGYNTLKFDDELLRFAFYRHLLPPYTHQYAQGCSRSDLLPLVVMYYLFKPDVLHWPEPFSLKLEALNAANDWVNGPAHRAMNDVEMCIHLIRQLSTERKMFDYLMGFFNKKTDQLRCQQLPKPFMDQQIPRTLALMILPSLGVEKAYQTPVLHLGGHQVYRNQNVWLRLDTIRFDELASEAWLTETRSIFKKWGEPGFLLPWNERYAMHLSQERQQMANANLTWLKEHPVACSELIQYHTHKTYPEVLNVDVEAQLYLNGFWSDEEWLWCETLHEKELTQWWDWIEVCPSPVIKKLALRLLDRRDPMKLNPHQRADLYAACAIDFKGQSKRTAMDLIQEIDALQSNIHQPWQAEILSHLKAYAMDLSN